jgi:hypothetical protein
LSATTGRCSHRELRSRVGERNSRGQWGIETITLCLDNDDSGRAATARIVEQSARAKNSPHVYVIDPRQLAPMNAVMRTIGGAIGGQVAASLLADGYPSEHGYTVTFTVMAVVLVASVAAALVVPGRRPHRAHAVNLGQPQGSLE